MAPRIQPGALGDILLDTLFHLGAEGTLFLTLLDQLLTTTDPCHIDEIIIGIAKLLKRLPVALYQLNSLFHPHARVEFNIRRSPVTSFVLRISNTSRIILLDSSPEKPSLHNLTDTRLRDILTNRTVGDRLYDDLYAVKDPALRDCLAQLAQDILDDPIPRTCWRDVLKFLLSCGGVPPSFLLYELEQLDAFYLTAFSDLYHGTLGTKRVAIKKPRVLKDELDRAEILREVIVCRQFRHPNILPFLGISCDEQDRLYGLVTPYMKHGSIIEFLRRYPNVNRLTPIWQVMKGLEFLHGFDPSVAHRDIKGANILVKDNLVCCLSDFGLSSMPELSQRSHEQAVGTAAWMAPEILAPPQHGRLDLLKVDIFALGITILEIYTGKPPLSNKNWLSIYTERVLRREKPLLPPACPHPFLSFLSEIVGMMLEYNIKTEATDQQSPVKRRAISTDNEPFKVLAREFVRKERERISESMKVKTSSNGAQSDTRSKLKARPITNAPAPLPFAELPVSNTTSDATKETWQLMGSILGNKSLYKILLNSRGEKAQDILSLMQKVLDHPSTPDDLRRQVLITMMRLCTASGAYPRCLVLQQVRYDTKAVAAGRFGEIWKGYLGDRRVSLKVAKLYQGSQIKHLLKSTAREAIVWSHLRHPNLLPFYGIYHLGDRYDRVCLVSPWMDNGNISDYLEADPEVSRLPLVYEILAGLGHLHKYSVVHGDLKGANILISSSGLACLADFGLSSVVDAEILRWTSLESMTRSGGTMRWEAPELMEDLEDGGSLRPTFSSDVYSVASVMYEILTGQVPYYELPRDAAVILRVVRGIKPSRPPPEPQLELSDQIWAVMEECWDHDPAKRPTVDQAANRLHKISSPQLTMKRMARDRKRRQGDESQALSPQAFRTAIQGSTIGFSLGDVNLLKEYSVLGRM